MGGGTSFPTAALPVSGIKGLSHRSSMFLEVDPQLMLRN